MEYFRTRLQTAKKCKKVFHKKLDTNTQNASCRQIVAEIINMANKDKDLVIGIDLGTTNSCVAYYYKGQRGCKLEVLENSDGDRVTPSFLYFTEQNKVIVGKYAKHMAAANPERGIYEIKRFIGRPFDDPRIQTNAQYFSFKVKNVYNNPIVLIEKSVETINKSPVDLSAAILAKIKKDVEAKLGCAVKKAVITVPAYFNVSQREDTLAAGEKAGFTVLKLLNEPTAAALNYYYENDNQEDNYSLVYDLGGGTFDVAILKRSENNIDILAVDGDSYLGGKDFDNLIIDYVCDQLQKKYNYNPKTERRMMRRLQDKCEEAKKLLSTNDDAVITLEGVVEGFDTVIVPLTRNQFEIMAGDLIQRTIDIVNTCLRSSKIKKNEIKEVILSGGSTRIPKIQTMLRDYFDGKNLNKFVNPDECVAKGAALQAALLSKHPNQKLEEIRIVDVIPLSLGIGDIVDCMNFIINRNSAIPTAQQYAHMTVYDKQKEMRFDVYEGERLNVKKNRFLGTFSLTNLTPAPPGQCEVIVTMKVDHNGILSVSAKEKFRNNIRVIYTLGHKGDDEVKNAVKDAEDNKEDDELFRIFAARKQYVMRYCVAIKYNLEIKNLQQFFSDTYQRCENILKQAKILDNHSRDLEKMKSVMVEVEQKCIPIVRAYNFEFMPHFTLDI